MDFTIFDTGDPRSPGSGEPKSTDKAPEKSAAAGTAPHAQNSRPAQGGRKKSLPPSPGVYDPSTPRFPRGYLLTICTLVIESENAESSRILANLFRALYQDETAFNFSALKQLGALNREHAEKLIAAKLAGAYTPVEWERSFRLIEEFADPHQPTAPGNPGVGEETDHLDDALAGMREQYLAPPPEAPPRSLSPQQPERQTEKRVSGQNIERETVPPRQRFEKPVAAPSAPVITPGVKAEPQRAQPPPAPAERSRSIQQARLTEPTRPPERARPVEQHSRQQAQRKSQPAIQRAEPRQHFARTDPPMGYPRTEPPSQLSARQDRNVTGDRGEGDHKANAGPADFIVPPDSFRPSANTNSEAVRREPIINLDVPLESDRESNGGPERGGQDKLMYGLLALIIVAALAFVAINYSLFYKGGIPGLGKSAEVSRLPDSQARKVSASAAALSGPIDLMPVSQEKEIAPPRWMAFSAPRQTEEGPSKSLLTPADADGLAATSTSPALPVAMEKPSTSAFISTEAAATESESAPRGGFGRSKSPAAVKESPARASAIRAAAGSSLGKVALSDRSASRTPAAEANAPRDQAYLTFAVSPWGDVYVNGRGHGASPPLRRLEIEPGKHTVEIRNGDFAPYRAVVELEPQATVNIRQQFR